MSKVPKYWSSAKKYLSKKDKVMKYLIQKYSEPSEVTLNFKKRYFLSHYVKVLSVNRLVWLLQILYF